MNRMTLLIVIVAMAAGVPAVACSQTTIPMVRNLPDLAFGVTGVALGSHFLFNDDFVPVIVDRPDYFYQFAAIAGSLSYATSSILPVFWKGTVESLRRTQRIVDAGAILAIGIYAVASPHYDGDDGILLGLSVGLPAVLHLLSTFIPTPAE